MSCSDFATVHFAWERRTGLMKMSGKSPLGSPHPSAAIMTTKAKWAALGCSAPSELLHFGIKVSTRR